MNVPKIILAVIDDLYTFARDAVLAVLRRVGDMRRTPSEQRYALPARETHPLLSEHEEAEADDGYIEAPDEAFDEDETEDLSTFRSTAEIIETEIPIPDDRPQKNTLMYTGAEHTPLFQNPTIEFDGSIASIPYGAMVMVLEQQGRWSKVAYRDFTGWVLHDHLLDRSGYVYPEFIGGIPNYADDPNTLRVRAMINDEFGGAVAELPLQASEYVLYRLYRKGGKIEWPAVRPRTAGRWHTILRGVAGAHIDVVPKTGAIMEYVREDGTGHLAYVEAVFPEDTLRLTEANYPDSGIYNERIVREDVWKELRPIFITVRH